MADKQISARITEEDRRKFKAKLMLEGLTVQDFVEKIISKYLNNELDPVIQEIKAELKKGDND